MLKKPIDLDKTKALLKEFGLFEEAETPKNQLISPAQRDFYQELFNVALGQAADRLAKLLDGYVNLPVPLIRIRAVRRNSFSAREFKQSSATRHRLPRLCRLWHIG